MTHAIDLGADAIGLVFYPPSPRSVSVAQAVELVHDVPPFVSVVGLFVNATPDWIREVASNVGLTLLQFHGDETAGAVRIARRRCGFALVARLASRGGYSTGRFGKIST